MSVRTTLVGPWPRRPTTRKKAGPCRTHRRCSYHPRSSANWPAPRRMTYRSCRRRSRLHGPRCRRGGCRCNYHRTARRCRMRCRRRDGLLCRRSSAPLSPTAHRRRCSLVGPAAWTSLAPARTSITRLWPTPRPNRLRSWLRGASGRPADAVHRVGGVRWAPSATPTRVAGRVTATARGPVWPAPLAASTCWLRAPTRAAQTRMKTWTPLTTRTRSS